MRQSNATTEQNMATIDDERQDEYRAAIEQQQSNSVLSFYLNGKSIEDIALWHSVSPNTVRCILRQQGIRSGGYKRVQTGYKNVVGIVRDSKGIVTSRITLYGR